VAKDPSRAVMHAPLAPAHARCGHMHQDSCCRCKALPHPTHARLRAGPLPRTATAHAFAGTRPHVRLARDESRRTTADSGCRLRPPSRTAEPNAEHGARHAFYLCSPSRSLSCAASGTGYVAGQYDRCAANVYVCGTCHVFSRATVLMCESLRECVRE